MTHSVDDIFIESFRHILARQGLSESESDRLFTHVLHQEAGEARIAALLAALAVKGETFEELAGAAKALRKCAVPVHLDLPALLDITGTSGARTDTFNVSTAAAFVAAGAGCVLAKHGNLGIDRECGSADVLRACGVRIDLDADDVVHCIRETGIAYLFAPKFHPVFERVMPVRRLLGIRTLFHLIGPISNPASPHAGVIGVFAGEMTELFAYALKYLGYVSAMVVYGHDGMDEISVSAPTRVSELREGVIRTYNIRPENYFRDFTPGTLMDVVGGSVQQNADVLRAVLAGKLRGPKRDIVLINAGAAILTAGKAPDLQAGIIAAEQSIDSGAALEKLQQLIQVSNRLKSS